jgi:hypothetical protein
METVYVRDTISTVNDNPMARWVRSGVHVLLILGELINIAYLQIRRVEHWWIDNNK